MCFDDRGVGWTCEAEAMSFAKLWRKRAVQRAPRATTPRVAAPRAAAHVPPRKRTKIETDDGIVHSLRENGVDFDSNEPQYISLCGHVCAVGGDDADSTATRRATDCMACIAAGPWP